MRMEGKTENHGKREPDVSLLYFDTRNIYGIKTGGFFLNIGLAFSRTFFVVLPSHDNLGDGMFINQMLLILVMEDNSEIIKPAHLTCHFMPA